MFGMKILFGGLKVGHEKSSDPLGRLGSSTVRQLAWVLRYETCGSRHDDFEGWLGRQREKVAGLPFTLQRGIHLPRFLALDPKPLCGEHYRLDPKLVEWCFERLAHECSTRVDRVREFCDRYWEECRDVVREFIDHIGGIPSLYLSPDEFYTHYPYVSKPCRFRRVASGCRACMLAIVGGNEKALVALHANMLSRSWDRPPRLLKLVDAWIGTLGTARAAELRAEADTLTAELVCVRTLIREQHRERKSQGKKQTVQSSGRHSKTSANGFPLPHVRMGGHCRRRDVSMRYEKSQVEDGKGKEVGEDRVGTTYTAKDADKADDADALYDRLMADVVASEKKQREAAYDRKDNYHGSGVPRPQRQQQRDPGNYFEDAMSAVPEPLNLDRTRTSCGGDVSPAPNRLSRYAPHRLSRAAAIREADVDAATRTAKAASGRKSESSSVTLVDRDGNEVREFPVASPSSVYSNDCPGMPHRPLTPSPTPSPPTTARVTDNPLEPYASVISLEDFVPSPSSSVESFVPARQSWSQAAIENENENENLRRSASAPGKDDDYETVYVVSESEEEGGVGHDRNEARDIPTSAAAAAAAASLASSANLAQGRHRGSVRSDRRSKASVAENRTSLRGDSFRSRLSRPPSPLISSSHHPKVDDDDDDTQSLAGTVMPDDSVSNVPQRPPSPVPSEAPTTWSTFVPSGATRPAAALNSDTVRRGGRRTFGWRK